MSEDIQHNPDTLLADIELVERYMGTYNSDCPEFVEALDNILLFSRWVINNPRLPHD